MLQPSIHILRKELDTSILSEAVMHETRRNSFQVVALSHLLLPVLLSLSKASESADMSLPGCPDGCGEVPIPYPFGIGPNCSMSQEFELSCNTTNGTTAPYMYGVEFVNINLSLGLATVTMPVSSQCYDNRMKTNTGNSYYMNWSGLPFQLNPIKNIFTVIGCNTLAYALLTNDNYSYVGGCLSQCKSLESLTNGSCSGIGCCETTMPESTSTNYISVVFDSTFNSSELYNFSRCGYAMLIEADAFMFNTHYITTEELNDRNMPVVLDWAVGNTTCELAALNETSYACKSSYSVCVDVSSGLGYLCNCSNGYEGNPYLQEGCQGVS